MLAFDASSIVYAWDNYPQSQFPRVWEWLGAAVSSKEIVMLSVAHAEACSTSPNCGLWLDANGVEKVAPTAQILAEALRIKRALGITGDQYGAGVGENDILIVAHAKCHNLTLVSNEAKQPSLPQSLLKYKIPAVCAMPVADVNCMDFLEYLTSSGLIFG
jgi:predicted nucleic acid-binding protein